MSNWQFAIEALPHGGFIVRRIEGKHDEWPQVCATTTVEEALAYIKSHLIKVSATQTSAVGEETRSGPNTQNQQSTPGITTAGGGLPR